jgi:ABC-type transport system involved in multi-copper enzyme maturation permease subunit
MKTVKPIAMIVKYTILDEICQRSFVIMFVVCAAFVFLARGCYQGNYVMNGEALDAATVVTAVSKVAFHAIAIVTMFITALLSMRVFRRDRDGGMQSAILSKPITRRQYVVGKVAGLWALSAVFMLALQAVAFLTVVVSANVVIPGYFVAALLCSLNLLFVVIAVALFSLFMPETVAFLSIMGIAVVGIAIDGINALGASSIAQAMTGGAQGDLLLSKILYYVWPKLSGMQHFASFFMGGGIQGFRSAYALFNILFYCLMLGVLLLWRFGKKEIA